MTKETAIGSYTFNPSGRTIDFSSMSPAFEIRKLYAIINLKSNKVIYGAGLKGYGYTSLAGATLTLEYNTSGMLSSDPLKIMYDYQPTERTEAILGDMRNILSNLYAQGENQREIATSLFTDDSGATYVRRDVVTEGESGVTISVEFTDELGDTVTPGTGLRPLVGDKTGLQTVYEATSSGTGYTTGDVLSRIIITDTSAVPPTSTALWVNATTGLQIGPPITGHYSAVNKNIVVTSSELPTGASTAANQATVIASLASVDGALGTNEAPVAGDTGHSTVGGYLRWLRDYFYNKTGAKALADAISVAFSNDVSVTGGPSFSAIHTNLLTGNVGDWYDASSFHSVSMQVIGSSGISVGQIVFEQTNDVSAAAAGNVWLVEESTLATPTPLLNSISIPANVVRMFTAPVVARYVRIRISSGFTGGTVQAVACFSQLPYNRMTQTVHQATAAYLAVNATQSNPGSLLATVTPSNTANTTPWLVNTPVSSITDNSSTVNTTSTTSAYTPANSQAYSVAVNVSSVSGTNPTMDLRIEESDDGGGTWRRVYDFPRITVAGSYATPVMTFTGNRVRYVQTIGGSSPSFTRAIVRTVYNSVPGRFMRQIIDRSVDPNSAGSVTPWLNVEGCNTIEAVITMAGVTTTAPVFAIEASDTQLSGEIYDLSMDITSAASSSVASFKSGVLPKFIRARVKTAGSGATLGNMRIKAAEA